MILKGAVEAILQLQAFHLVQNQTKKNQATMTMKTKTLIRMPKEAWITQRKYHQAQK